MTIDQMRELGAKIASACNAVSPALAHDYMLAALALVKAAIAQAEAGEAVCRGVVLADIRDFTPEQREGYQRFLDEFFTDCGRRVEVSNG